MTTFEPGTPEELALILRGAARGGEMLSVRGAGSWSEVGADAVVSTAALDQITELAERDLTVSVGAGVTLRDLAARLGDAGVWAAWDPPGTDRTVGSVVATATDGPVALGFGPIRDQLLGLTLVTWGGRVVTVGGRVMKNVAGFDVTRLACGSFGSLGIITSVNVRLRALPASDSTITCTGSFDGVSRALGAIVEGGLAPAALELIGPTADKNDWTLALRLVGSEPSIAVDSAAVERVTGLQWIEDPADRWVRQHSHGPVTLKIGSTVGGLGQVLDLIRGELPHGDLTAGMNSTRWSGDVNAAAISEVRRRAGEVGCPLTVERAPPEVLGSVGIFGGLDRGSATIINRLRDSYDPYQLWAGGDALVVD